MDKKVFVAGGSGFVGSHVVRSLMEKGYGVKALIRDGARGYLPDGAETVSGDILHPENWRGAVFGCFAFVNLVGIIREFPKEGITFKRLHVEAAAKAVETCRRAGVEKYVHMSACGASPDGPGEYLKTKYEAETLVKTSGLDYTIFRPSLIFGPEDRFLNDIARVIKSLSAFPVPGDGRYKFQPVYVGDTAEIFARCVDDADCRGRTFCLGGPKVYDFMDILKSVAHAIGAKAYFPRVPVKMAESAVSFMGRFRFFPVTSDQLKMLLEGNVCSNDTAFSTLGVKRKSMDEYLKRRFSSERKGGGDTENSGV